MDVIASRVEYRSSVFIKTVFTSNLGQNVGFGEGWAGSFPERYNDPMLLGKGACGQTNLTPSNILRVSRVKNYNFSLVAF